ncbi:hypothetical protein AMELA_G00037390 [Ameiurus melas]|uniref:Uncharacterized protein n=1 Tax=Ameiurus melas TaxID=219545 RepID=A0A7J6B964_AMEME|nr:hypothetical protein AMELA_G00037390 [Ameiurus melas]
MRGVLLSLSVVCHQGSNGVAWLFNVAPVRAPAVCGYNYVRSYRMIFVRAAVSTSSSDHGSSSYRS